MRTADEKSAANPLEEQANMDTIEQPQAPDRGSRAPVARGSSARAAAAEAVMLLVTILGLIGAAAGIAIGFPQALEAVSTHANASIASSLELPGRYRTGPEGTAPDGEIEVEAPVIVDDVRSGERMHAAAPAAVPRDGSALQPSGDPH
jgi:hypothetical protein